MSPDTQVLIAPGIEGKMVQKTVCSVDVQY